MIFTRTVLMLSVLASGILISPVQGIVKLTQGIPIKCTVSENIIHFAQYTTVGNLVASYNEKIQEYRAAFATEYGALNYSAEDAEALFKLFSAQHKRLASPLGTLLS